MPDKKNYDPCEESVGGIKIRKVRVKKGRPFDALIDIYKDFFWSDRKENSEKWIFKGNKRDPRNAMDCSTCRGASASVCRMTNVALMTSLEKALSKFMIAEPGKREEETKRKWENDIIRSFKRRAQRYESCLPEDGDILEWLALIQHYFGPTRLLDFTYSFFIACYFAINELDCDKKELSEVWAIDAEWLSRKGKDRAAERIAGIIGHRNFRRLTAKGSSEAQIKHLDKNCTFANKVIYFLMRKPKACVYNVNPFRLNERLVNQQGTFLLQGDINKCFVWNLKETFRDDISSAKEHLLRVVIEFSTKKQRNELLQDLDRMGINQAMLFPDLRGFAESLIRRVAFPERRIPP